MASEHHSADYNQLLSAYLDGEVTTVERAELLQHLATCASCRATMDQYRSIGTRLRGMPPVHSPDELTGAIYAQTVDAPPRRLSLLTSRAGYPLAAVAAVLLVFVVAIFLLVDGYQRRIDPAIVGSQPVVGGLANIKDPIRITFNKEMDRESVENALTIKPTSELQRLGVSWEGNTLVIGGKVPLKPSSDYDISFSSQAHDKWGNPLSEPFSLKFGTSTTIEAFESPEAVVPTPSAEARAPAVPSPQVTATETPAPPSTPASPTVTPEIGIQTVNTPTPVNTPVPPTQNGTGTGDDISGTNDGDVTPQPPAPPQQPSSNPDPTETPQPTATSEPEPVETAEPTPVPSTPTETPISEPTVTIEPTTEPEPTEIPATSTVEPTPTQTPLPEQAGVEGSFGNVYWSNELVRLNLGEPIDVAVEGVGALELDFQSGKMFQKGADGSIYVMYTAGGWDEFAPPSGELIESAEGSEAGLWIPGGVFGVLWTAESSVATALGEALEGKPHEFSTTYQEFEGGIMLSGADDFIYVLYINNVTWELYPDAGPLSDGEPTPVPAS